ncbi:hypothetical protein pb186bvf_011064 [Paramecium bursaria]
MSLSVGNGLNLSQRFLRFFDSLQSFQIYRWVIRSLLRIDKMSHQNPLQKYDSKLKLTYLIQSNFLQQNFQ